MDRRATLEQKHAAIYLSFFYPSAHEVEGDNLAKTSLYNLESTVSQRKAEMSASQDVNPSWTKKLLLNSGILCSDIRYIDEKREKHEPRCKFGKHTEGYLDLEV